MSREFVKLCSIAILGVFIFINVKGVTAQETPLSFREKRQIASSVVRILAESRQPQFGSGVIVDQQGIIFTNAHVIEDAPLNGIQIGLFTSFEQPPEMKYLARPILISESLDFAVLEIYADNTGLLINTSQLKLQAIEKWDTATIGLSETIFLFAYPNLAGGNLSLTSGKITSIPTEDLSFYLSDATFAQGGSGGVAVNTEGAMIGLPYEATQANYDSKGSLTRILRLDTICRIESKACEYKPLVQPSPEPSISERQAYVCVDPEGLNVRLNPSIDAQKIDNLQSGTRVQVTGNETVNEGYLWHLIITEDGNRGWAASNADNYQTLLFIETSASLNQRPQLKVGIHAITCTTSNDSLRMRFQPRISANVFRFLPTGTEVTMVDGPVRNGEYDWWKVSTPSGHEGWVVEAADGLRTLLPLPN